MPHAFSERLAEGPLLCDGAMGTVLYARGVPLDACFDVLNLNNPRVVQAVHADYVPMRQEIQASYAEGEVLPVQMHDGSRIRLRKLDKDYDPTHRGKAFEYRVLKK